jgi:hypothetical protein
VEAARIRLAGSEVFIEPHGEIGGGHYRPARGSRGAVDGLAIDDGLGNKFFDESLLR